MSHVRKAVIPAAGLGTRFLPATKSVPKEMLPIVDQPAIQYVIDEAVGAGIEDILIITSPSKKSLEDHFDRDFELESLLESRGKTTLLNDVLEIPKKAKIYFTRQGQPLGLGHAIGMASSWVGDEPFATLLPDDILVDGGGLLKRMIDVQSNTGGVVLAAGHYPLEEVIAYGVIDPLGIDDGIIDVGAIVEKPPIEEAASNYGLAPGRYVFPASIFEEIAATEPGVGGEIQITDAIQAMIERTGVCAVLNEGRRYDAGQKLDYLRATVELALEHPELGSDFRALLATIVSEHGIA
ncbi:MAG: UTP--glucose-1-phosphate uridylyltransferase [Actinomycetota bacterium]